MTDKTKGVKAIIHDAFGDYIENVQLSTKDYNEELGRVASGICQLFEPKPDIPDWELKGDTDEF